MASHLKLYLTTILAFFAIDMVWLGFIATDFYQAQIGHLLAPEVNWVAAIVFYLLFLFGLLFFAVVPGLQAGSLRQTLVRGALYGLITYATYDLTNQATLKDWPVLVTVADLLWGMSICTITSWISHLAGRRFRSDKVSD